jgi:Skp family chaperone for outer membrane proteins
MTRSGLSARGGLAAALLLLALIIPPAPLTAQEGPLIRSPILSLDQDRMFAVSAFGQRIEAELQADGRLLETENRRIEAELEAEEKDLTARRPAMSAEAFRALADAFDTKVQRIRTEQTAKARALGQRTEEAQRQFIEAARPVLEQMMVDAGAVVIIDPRSVVMSRAAIDVTDEAIRRINANIGDGLGRPMPAGPGPDSPNSPDQPAAPLSPATPDSPASPQD